MRGNERTNEDGSGRRLRRRLRGAFSGKRGKAVGVAAVAAPVIGLIVEDLKSPDSLIRQLANRAAARWLPSKPQPEAIDITDRVEIVNDSDTP